MRLPIFVVDAFAERPFTGNPAAVVPLPRFLPDGVLQAIAAENNLSETAFVTKIDADYHLRWFTPTVEVPLCGHATLASAAVIMEQLEPERRAVRFHTASGVLSVTRAGDEYVMHLPLRRSTPIATPPALAAALGGTIVEVCDDTFNYLAIFADESDVRGLAPNMLALAQLDRGGVIATAPGNAPYDFISRYFAPQKGVDEDPVTGSAHCTLTPYWTERLGKPSLCAWQASRRGGALVCRVDGDRVELRGRTALYLRGEIELPASTA